MAGVQGQSQAGVVRAHTGGFISQDKSVEPPKGF